MTCEWAEGYLSEYLEGALDPQVREQVASHVDGCANCQNLLNDYQRDEQLLRTLPTGVPDDHLRERIFDSPEYASLTRRRTHGGRPRMMRALLPAAALVALALGAGLVARGHFLASSATTQHVTHTIAGPASFAYPLASGQRVIFARDGALWSAPETPASSGATASAPQQLTPADARVIAWSVAPARAARGGQLVAWIDGQTGALHLVRADGLTDLVVAQIAPKGQAIPAAALGSLAWSSDSAHLAFVSVDASGALTLHVITTSRPDTTSGAQVSPPIAISGLTGAPVWSADGQGLAWVATSASGSQSVWTLRNGAVAQVASQVDPASGQATVARPGWSGSAVTWATQENGQITGVFAAIPGATSATRLTPAQARYTTAALNAQGEWLLASQGALWRISADTRAPALAARLASQATQVIWSPNGQSAAILMSGGATTQLSFWTPGAGLWSVAADIASDATPAWSADSQSLAYVAGGKAMIIALHGGQSVSTIPAGAIGTPATLAWSPDDGAVAITDARGVYLASRDGLTFTLITSRAPSASSLAWSTAG